MQKAVAPDPWAEHQRYLYLLGLCPVVLEGGDTLENDAAWSKFFEEPKYRFLTAQEVLEKYNNHLCQTFNLQADQKGVKLKLNADFKTPCLTLTALLANGSERTKIICLPKKTQEMARAYTQLTAQETHTEHLKEKANGTWRAAITEAEQYTNAHAFEKETFPIVEKNIATLEKSKEKARATYAQCKQKAAMSHEKASTRFNFLLKMVETTLQKNPNHGWLIPLVPPLLKGALRPRHKPASLHL